MHYIQWEKRSCRFIALCVCFFYHNFLYFLTVMATEGGNKADGKFRHRGVSFKMNEVVNIVAGTAAGVPGKKTEAMRAWFKGDDKGTFICRPVIGGGRGPLPRFAKDTVYKLKVNLTP